MGESCYFRIRKCSDHLPADLWVPREALGRGRTFTHAGVCYYIPYYTKPSAPGVILPLGSLNFAAACPGCLTMYKLAPCGGGRALGTAQNYTAYVGQVVRLGDGKCYTVSVATTPIAEADPVFDAVVTGCGDCPCVDGTCAFPGTPVFSIQPVPGAILVDVQNFTVVSVSTSTPPCRCGPGQGGPFEGGDILYRALNTTCTPYWDPEPGVGYVQGCELVFTFRKNPNIVPAEGDCPTRWMVPYRVGLPQLPQPGTTHVTYTAGWVLDGVNDNLPCGTITVEFDIVVLVP